MKKLKYKELIENYSNDISHFEEKEIQSFRWVFDDINDKRNFLPVYILDEERRINDEKKNKATSIGYSLSLFTTLEYSKKRLMKILSDKPKAYLKLGTHIACGNLAKDDGLCDNPNSEKHFSLFEYSDLILADKYNIIEKIV